MLSINDVSKAAVRAVNNTNAMSFLNTLNKYGRQFGLDKPHRYVQLGAQIMHESGEFRYDREIWGPTPAQERYDTRTDLGNTAAKDGDGKKYMGRGPIQVTGKSNYQQFTDWCRKNVDPEAPDFVKDPDRINTDPWEGMSALWYWSTRDLNKYADAGDIEMITKKINGGTNGFDDRVKYYARLALVTLGYSPDALKQFQREKKLEADGDPGPKTRAALHKALVDLVPATKLFDSVKDAPVVQLEAVVPKAIDKPVTQTSGFWERIVGIGGSGTIMALAPFLTDWKIIVAIAGGMIVLAIVGLFLHKRIIDAVKSIKDEIQR